MALPIFSSARSGAASFTVVPRRHIKSKSRGCSASYTALTRGHAESPSPSAPSPRCLWNSASGSSSSTRQGCCMLRGASRSTRLALPHWRCRSPQNMASHTSLAQTTPQRPSSGAADVTVPGSGRASLGSSGHTRSPFARSPGRTSQRAASGSNSDSRASTTRRRERTSQRWSARPCPLAIQSTKSPSSLSSSTELRRTRHSSPRSRVTRTRPPTKPVIVPRWSSARAESRSLGSSSPSPSSTVFTKTESPTRRPSVPRTTWEGSTATMCHGLRSTSAETGAQAVPSSKSEVRQPPLAAISRVLCSPAAQRRRWASNQRRGPVPNSTSGASH
mmetsp:Transcript_94931/g.301208  ORF Transcript_94931/g.301208 Transcript_94931/m.301208 type:complete len:332 (+) Transcript_94931:176-1171(+)